MPETLKGIICSAFILLNLSYFCHGQTPLIDSSKIQTATMADSSQVSINITQKESLKKNGKPLAIILGLTGILILLYNLRSK